MVRLARERAPGADVMLGSAEKLPFADASFTAIAMSIVFFFPRTPSRLYASVAASSHRAVSSPSTRPLPRSAERRQHPSRWQGAATSTRTRSWLSSPAKRASGPSLWSTTTAAGCSRRVRSAGAGWHATGIDPAWSRAYVRSTPATAPAGRRGRVRPRPPAASSRVACAAGREAAYVRQVGDVGVPRRHADAEIVRRRTRRA